MVATLRRRFVLGGLSAARAATVVAVLGGTVLCGVPLGVVGCLSSPTLPLPPPSSEPATVPVSGYTRLQGSVPEREAETRVLALNQRTGLVFGETTTTGRYSFLAAAQVGDLFQVWYTIGGEQSEAVEIVVPDRDEAALLQNSSCVDAGGCDGGRDGD